MYQPDKTNVLISPSVNVGKYENVHLQYRRWLNVEDSFFDRATIYANDVPVWTNYSAGENGDTHHEDKEWRFHSIDVSDQLYRGGVQIKYELQIRISSLMIMNTHCYEKHHGRQKRFIQFFGK